MLNRYKVLCLLGPSMLFSGCALLPANEDPELLAKLTELERRLESIERVVQGQSLVNLTQQVSATERRGDEMQGRLEELEHHSESTSERQRQLYVDLDARIIELEAAMRDSRSVSVMDGGTLPPGQLPMPGGSDRDNYQAAFELLKEQRYEPAALAFQQFLVAFPDSELADNAQYWLAESHYVTQQFDKALAEFEVVISQYADSRKIPDALLKMGYCNYELNRWDSAREALARVQTDYSETTAARLAAQRLQRMDEEGV
ncbi:MAG: tol-pal system protein YbgF [Gammaproteobacteria bacterium]|nr:tol-pal system protein YbgF [Gammaproteobacteria bacterium]